MPRPGWLCFPPTPAFNIPHLMGGTSKALSERLILDLAELVDHRPFQMSTLKGRGRRKQGHHWSCVQGVGRGGLREPPREASVWSECLHPLPASRSPLLGSEERSGWSTPEATTDVESCGGDAAFSGAPRLPLPCRLLQQTPAPTGCSGGLLRAASTTCSWAESPSASDYLV